MRADVSFSFLTSRAHQTPFERLKRRLRFSRIIIILASGTYLYIRDFSLRCCGPNMVQGNDESLLILI